jgi:hypothetical protein
MAAVPIMATATSQAAVAIMDAMGRGTLSLVVAPAAVPTFPSFDIIGLQ